MYHSALGSRAFKKKKRTPSKRSKASLASPKTFMSTGSPPPRLTRVGRRVQGVGCKCRVQGAGCKCRVQGVGCKCRVQGVGCEVHQSRVVENRVANFVMTKKYRDEEPQHRGGGTSSKWSKAWLASPKTFASTGSPAAGSYIAFVSFNSRLESETTKRSTCVSLNSRLRSIQKEEKNLE